LRQLLKYNDEDAKATMAFVCIALQSEWTTCPLLPPASDPKHHEQWVPSWCRRWWML